MTTMSDLSRDLEEEILCRVPITSLGAVRSTCKRWNLLSKDQSFAKKHCGKAAKETLVVRVFDDRACLICVNLHGIHNQNDLGDPFIGQIGKLNQTQISKVFHCDGLLLCVTRNYSRLVVLNPYSGQNRWIQPKSKNFHILDRFSIGYDSNNNHKILRVSHWFDDNEYQIYDFKSNLWRVLDVTTNWKIFPGRSVSLKGNSYFTAVGKLEGHEEVKEKSLFCFDFTRERFGGRLPLPFHIGDHDSVILSTVREEKLAVLFKRCDTYETKIWITTMIEPNAVSWSYFLKLDRVIGFSGRRNGFEQSFFVDEKKKVVVIFDIDREKRPNYKAYIIKEDGYYREVDLEESRHVIRSMCSYVPSWMQIQ